MFNLGEMFSELVIIMVGLRVILKMKTSFAPAELEIVNSGQFVDWQDLMYRKQSWNQEHNLSLAHGSEKTQMMILGGYRNEEGYYKTNDFTRYTLSVNLDHRINKLVKVGLSSRLSHNKRNLFWVPDVNMLYMNPTAQPYNEAGNDLESFCSTNS